MRHSVILLLVSFLLVPSEAAETILVRKRPVKLEEGVARVLENGPAVDIEKMQFTHTAKFELTQIVRELGGAREPSEEPPRTLRLAAKMNDAEWKQLLDGLHAWLESLDPSSFHSPWAGLEVGRQGEDVWSELFEGVSDYLVLLCLEPADGEATAHRLFGRTVDEQQHFGRDSRPAEQSREWCGELERTLWGDPSRELRTFPSTLEEEVWRIGASQVDRSHSGDAAELPGEARLDREERAPAGKSRQWRDGTSPAPEGHADEAPRRYEHVERREEELDDGNEAWIVSRATETDIATESWDDVRFLGWRIAHEAVRSYAGVMPTRDLPLTAPGEGVLIWALPDAAVSPAAQDRFLRDVAERIDRSERSLTVAALADAVSESLGTLDLSRHYVIVCHRDELGDWKATYQVDEASARVLNSADVCAEVDRRIPME